MSHDTGNKVLSYDGNLGLHNFQLCFTKSNSYLLLNWITSVLYINYLHHSE